MAPQRFGSTVTRERGADQQGYVLVIEDDASIRELIGMALENEGFRYRASADGQEALSRIEEEQPALLLLDLGLPVADGEAVAAFTQHRYGGAVPIIVVSAVAQMDARTWRIGARAFVHKPFDVDHLIDTVRRVLSERR
ncbi:MAG TPA: response regulator [Dehalococcoidia bacterium]|nr:response regulator [Dehalococcoidia bacterium]